MGEEEEFWKTESGWVLLRTSRGFLPFNRETRMAMLIDDDEKAETTHKQMLHDGVPVIDEDSVE